MAHLKPSIRTDRPHCTNADLPLPPEAKKAYVYAWIWSRLLGGTTSKTLLFLLLILGVSGLLLLVVFPWLDPRTPLDSVTVGR